MDKLISVIVPNFNAEKYIVECLDSIFAQEYNNLEVIVIDDGSTDRSWELISAYAASHNQMKCYQQVNMNASIARNRGIEMAKGEYLFFLDSDDVLYKGALKTLVEHAEEAVSDLVIGNFDRIDEKSTSIQKCKPVKKAGKFTDTMNFVGDVPNPSNKLYKRKVIDQYSIRFGNVRIGQDLNFYLKYLGCCQSVLFVDCDVYGWRFVKGSISNSFNFKIFDISESFNDVKRFYEKNGLAEIYERYIKTVEYRHYYLQMEKQKSFSDKKAKKIVVDYFSFLLSKIDIEHCDNFETIKSDVEKCKIKLRLRSIYTSVFYTWLDKKFAGK